MSIYIENPEDNNDFKFLTKYKATFLLPAENKIYKTLGIDNCFKRFIVLEKKLKAWELKILLKKLRTEMIQS